MVVLFVDLKAIVDSVDRGLLIKEMRKREVREELVRRCEEILRETINKIRKQKKEGKGFWTERTVRQGCPLSPSLFTLLMTDLEDELKKAGWGGIKIGERKIYTLAYADDVALLDEERIKEMMGKLERYLEENDLYLNISKTKIMRCRKGGDRWKRMYWVWKGKRGSKAMYGKYLGYTMKCNGRQ